MRNVFYFILFLFLSAGLPTTSVGLLFSQQDQIDFHCSFSGSDTTITDEPAATPLTGTTNMAIILCVEKGQPKEISLPLFINEIKQNIPDYFDKVTFGNYNVNITDVLVKDIDSSAGYATLFELPDTIYFVSTFLC